MRHTKHKKTDCLSNPSLSTIEQKNDKRAGRQSANLVFWDTLLAPLVLIFHFRKAFQVAALRRELEPAIAAETEAAVGNTKINYEAASAAVETEVVVVVAVAVDTAVAPEAGNSGSGYGSGGGGGVDVGSGDDDGGDESNGNGDGSSAATTTTTTETETTALAATTTTTSAATEASTVSNQ